VAPASHLEAIRAHAPSHSTAHRGECDLCEAWIFFQATLLRESDRARVERLGWPVS